MAAEAGKTLAEADTEVSEAVDFARYYAGLARHLERLDGVVARPLGVVAVAGPWNFPLAIPIGGAVGRLAAGNAAIVKPAPRPRPSPSPPWPPAGRPASRPTRCSAPSVRTVRWVPT